jgi:hypothetical protein
MDGSSFVFRQFDESERFQTHSNRPRLDFCVSATDNPRGAKVPDPFVASR